MPSTTTTNVKFGKDLIDSFTDSQPMTLAFQGTWTEKTMTEPFSTDNQYGCYPKDVEPMKLTDTTSSSKAEQFQQLLRTFTVTNDGAHHLHAERYDKLESDLVLGGFLCVTILHTEASLDPTKQSRPFICVVNAPTMAPAGQALEPEAFGMDRDDPAPTANQDPTDPTHVTTHGLYPLLTSVSRTSRHDIAEATNATLPACVTNNTAWLYLSQHEEHPTGHPLVGSLVMVAPQPGEALPDMLKSLW